jgi:hypothetical protein
MLLDLISAASAALGLVGVVLILGWVLRRVAGVILPRWIVPASAGVAMLGFSIWNEYSWFDRVSAQIAPPVVVAIAPVERGLLRPWTYLHPITLRFVAADLGRIAVSSADPALRVIPVFVVERWSPTRGLTVAVDCAAGRRADLPEGDAAGADVALSTVAWQDVGLADPIVVAACAGG